MRRRSRFGSLRRVRLSVRDVVAAEDPDSSLRALAQNALVKPTASESATTAASSTATSFRIAGDRIVRRYGGCSPEQRAP
jgi:hypothetical protein